MLLGDQAQADVLRTNTDSPQYCGELVTRISLLPRPLPEPVSTLAREGQNLCDQGQVRLGVAKLRRALRAAQNP